MRDLLNQLNPEQKKAVEQIYGPVLVLAGPGTGKTHLLTTRIAYLLQQNIGVEPQNILCLTFTESGAVEMRDRLQKWIGNEAYRVKISTFHGFCEWVMQEYPQYFETNRGNREIGDDLQKALVFQEVMKSKKWNYFFNIWDEFTFQRDILKAISDFKRENITPQKLRDLLSEEKKYLENDPDNFYKKKYGKFQAGDFKPGKRIEIDQKIEKMAELADVWEAYEKKLSDHGYFDFDDQIMWVLQEIQTNENLKYDLQEKFQWILVDEYQDTNSAQNVILWTLTDYENPNIFAVGDDDQAIYRFQGASVKNIFDFQNHFSKSLQVILSKNYRSAQNILDGAFQVIAHNLDRIDTEKKLIASGKDIDYPGTITKAVFGSRYLELAFLVEQIRHQLKQGVAPHEISILVRKNVEVLEIARELPKFGIPVAAQVFQNIFENSYVKILILMMEIFSDPLHDEKIMELLHTPFWNISARKLLQFSLGLYKQKGKSAIEFLLEQSEKDETLKKVLDLIVESRKNYRHCRPEVLTEKLLYESGLAEYLVSQKDEDTIEAWQNIRKFLDWIRDQKQCEDLKTLLDRIHLQNQLHIAIRPDPIPGGKRSVQVMTAHKAKGQEFKVVFIPGLLDRVWGNTRDWNKIPMPHIFKDEHDSNEDERRLFFVACTRAKKELYLSYSETDFSGKDKNPSIFWHELSDDLCAIFPMDKVEESLQKILPVFLSSGDQVQLLPEEKELLAENVKRFIWSATSLQNFIECPRRFLYQNLYKLPRKPLPYLALGTALHEALEKYMRVFKETKILPDKQVLLDQFERALRGQNLEREDFKKFQEHGKSVLENYFTHRKEEFSPQNLIEFNFGQFAPAIDGIRVTGKMDKIVFFDNHKLTAKIVDYKSGKLKPIKKGERFWRQLVFYDLLARNSKGVSWKVESCELEFLTPDSNGKLGVRNYKVTEEDRIQVIQELKEAHKKLQNFEFPFVPNPENDPEIDYWQSFGKLKTQN